MPNNSGQSLRNLLLNDAEISLLLGFYEFSGGGTSPAIAVGWRYPPPGTRVTGLELAILPDADAPVSPLLNSSNRWDFSTTIIIKQWDPAGSTLPMAMAIVPLLQPWGTVSVRPAVLPVESLGNIETRRIDFVESLVYRR